MYFYEAFGKCNLEVVVHEFLKGAVDSPDINVTEETGAAFCSRVPSYFPINCKDDCHFLPRKKELYCKDYSRLGRDTACMTARENDKVYNNGQRCGEFIDKKEDEFTEILLFWKSQGWYERTKIDRMLDDFEKFYAEIKEI